MSKHVATTAEAELSPKVKSAGVWITVFVVVGGALASAIAAIPESAWESLGVWAGPVGVFVGGIGAGLAAVVAAYRKRDPLREIGGAAVAAGGTAPALPGDGVGEQTATAPVDPVVADADALAAKAARMRGEV